MIDPDGRDWYDINGKITWHEHEGMLTINDQTYQSLGKNVLVGTHVRDKNGNEEINSTIFELYLETNTEGASASIKGNSVPGDVTKFGILAEGIFPARFQGRASKLAKGIDDSKPNFQVPVPYTNPIDKTFVVPKYLKTF